MVKAVDPKVRFWYYVNKTDTCWLWTGGTLRGYGQFRNAPVRPTDKAHRFSYELHFGEIPEGMFVLHRCDNTLCVNPEHLFLGTHQINMEDMVSKGRQARGERNGKSKITEAIAKEIIRRRNESTQLLHKEFNASYLIIQRIKAGTAWKHLSR